MWLGECWMQQGMLASPDDIRFASWALVQQTVTGDVSPSAFADAVVRGKKEWHRAEHKEAPDFLRGERPLELDTDVRRLQGLGISEGRIEGVVRILATPEDGHRLHSGDILVARSRIQADTAV